MLIRKITIDRIAYHEAGQAITAHVIGIKPKLVTLKPNRKSLGRYETWRFLTPDVRLALDSHDRDGFGANKS